MSPGSLFPLAFFLPRLFARPFFLPVPLPPPPFPSFVFVFPPPGWGSLPGILLFPQPPFACCPRCCLSCCVVVVACEGLCLCAGVCCPRPAWCHAAALLPLRVVSSSCALLCVLFPVPPPPPPQLFCLLLRGLLCRLMLLCRASRCCACFLLGSVLLLRRCACLLCAVVSCFALFWCVLCSLSPNPPGCCSWCFVVCCVVLCRCLSFVLVCVQLCGVVQVCVRAVWGPVPRLILLLVVSLAAVLLPVVLRSFTVLFGACVFLLCTPVVVHGFVGCLVLCCVFPRSVLLSVLRCACAVMCRAGLLVPGRSGRWSLVLVVLLLVAVRCCLLAIPVGSARCPVCRAVWCVVCGAVPFRAGVLASCCPMVCLVVSCCAAVLSRAVARCCVFGCLPRCFALPFCVGLGSFCPSCGVSSLGVSGSSMLCCSCCCAAGAALWCCVALCCSLWCVGLFFFVLCSLPPSCLPVPRSAAVWALVGAWCCCLFFGFCWWVWLPDVVFWWRVMALVSLLSRVASRRVVWCVGVVFCGVLLPSAVSCGALVPCGVALSGSAVLISLLLVFFCSLVNKPLKKRKTKQNFGFLKITMRQYPTHTRREAARPLRNICLTCYLRTSMVSLYSKVRTANCDWNLC